MRALHLMALTASCLLTLWSCSPNAAPSDQSKSYTLRLVNTNDTTEHRATVVVDTTVVNQITIIVTGRLARNGQRQLNVLHREHDAFYDRKYFPDETTSKSDSLDLLVLALFDTTYTYLFDSERFMPLAPVGTEDYQLSIASLGNNLWKSKRCNAHDTSYCTTLVYDHRYRMHSAEFLIGERRYLFGQ